MIRVALDTNAYAGFKRGDADLVEVIAAGSLQHGLALVTRDRHFARIDGLITGADLAAFLP